MTGFIVELKKRKVIRSIFVYLIFSWALIQIADTIAPALNLPDWTLTLVIILVVVCFPFVVVLSWFFELTPKGIKKETLSSNSQNKKMILTSCGLMLLISIAGSSYYFITKVQPLDENSAQEKQVKEHSLEAEKSVALLPLAWDENFKTPVLAENFYKDLTRKLSGIKGINVISIKKAQESKAYPLSKVLLKETLDVNFFVEGRITPFEKDLRLTLQLIEAVKESSIWKQSFIIKANTESLIDAQTEISQQISKALLLSQNPDQTIDKQIIATNNFEAYTLYHLAQNKIAKRTSKDISDAVLVFKESILLDPNYAHAYAGLAFAYAMQTMYGTQSHQEMLQLAMPVVQRALVLEPKLAEGHSVLGWLRYKGGDFRGSKSSFLKAINLNDKDPLIFHLFATTLAEQGINQEAIKYRRIALRLDPMSVATSNTLAEDLLALGEYQESLEQYKYSLRIQPQSAQTFAHVANLCRTGLARPDKAAVWLEAAIKIDPQHSGYPAQLAETLLDLGLTKEATEYAAQAFHQGESHYWPNRAMSLSSSATNNLKRAAFHGEKITQRTSFSSIALSAIRNYKFSTGNFEEAKLAYLEQVPELFSSEVSLTESNLMNAIDLALVFQYSGESEKARNLLSQALNQIDGMPRFGPGGYEIYDVFVWNILGNKDRALSALQQAIENGWYQYWYLNQDNPNLQGLIAEPRYKELLQRVKLKVIALQKSYQQLKGSDVNSWSKEPC